MTTVYNPNASWPFSQDPSDTNSLERPIPVKDVASLRDESLRWALIFKITSYPDMILVRWQRTLYLLSDRTLATLFGRWEQIATCYATSFERSEGFLQ